MNALEANVRRLVQLASVPPAANTTSQVSQAPTSNVRIGASASLIAVRKFTLAAGVLVTMGADSWLKVL